MADEPVLCCGGKEGKTGGDEGADGLEPGDGLGRALDLVLEREQAVDLVVDGLERGP